jgi:hypothetical protein
VTGLNLALIETSRKWALERPPVARLRAQPSVADRFCSAPVGRITVIR